MSNGVAYVLDEAGTLESRINPEMVQVEPLDEQDADVLQRLVREHEEKTVSPRARTILVQWADFRTQFRKVAPIGAFALVAAAREAYLRAPVEQELELARRTA
jgi:glutamate synthase domain-containing protein 3